MNRSIAALVVLSFLALAAAAVVYAARTLRIDTQTEALLSPELDFRQDQIAFEQRFPRAGASLIAVVDAALPERADQAADLLASALADRPQLFAEAYRPDGGPFLDRHALLFLSIDELERLSTRLADAQPFLGRLVADTTLRALADLLIEAMDDSIDAPEQTLARLLRALADATPDPEDANPPPELSWRLVVAQDPDEEPDTRRLVLLRPNLDSAAPTSKAAIVSAVNDAEAALPLDRLHARVRVTGPTALERDEFESVMRSMMIAVPLSLLLVAGLLFIAMRSFALVGASLLTLAVGLTFTLGFAALAIGRLNLISIAFGVLYVGLGADFAIHLALHVRARRDEGFAPRDALRAAIRDVFGSLCLCTITTMVGFYVFIPTSFDGVSELGLIAGTGMLISLIATLLFFPAAMTLLPSRWNAPTRSLNGARLRALIHAPERRRGAVLVVALIVAVFAAALIPHARFDPDPLNLRDQDSESVRTLRELRAAHGSDNWALSAIVPDEQAAADVRRRLAQNPLVDKAVWIGSFIPEQQEAKLALIDDLAFILGPTLDPPPSDSPAAPPPPTFAETIESLTALRQALAAADETSPSLRTAAGLLHEALARWLETARENPDARAALRDAWLGTFPLLIEQIRTSLTAQPISRRSLPPAILERWVSDDGAHRIQVFPAVDLEEPDAKRRFIAAVREIAPTVVGSPIAHIEAGDAVVAAFQQALLWAFIAVVAIAFIAFRSALTMIETIAPIILAAAMTVAAMALLDQTFNFANVIALPLLMGVGIDSAIHLVHRSKAGTHDRLLESAAARAVLFSALTTIAGFGSLAFSPHPGMASMGLILALGMAAMLLSSLIVLPALLTFRAPARRKLESA